MHQLDTPLHLSAPIHNIESSFKAYGRLNRMSFIAHYAVISIIVSIIMMVFLFIVSIMFIAEPMPNTFNLQDPSVMALLASMVVVYIVMIYIIVCIGIRRLHDCEHSGCWMLTLLIPLVNVILSLYLLCAPGTAGANTYGAVRPSAQWEVTVAWIFIIFNCISILLAAIAFYVMTHYFIAPDILS